VIHDADLIATVESLRGVRHGLSAQELSDVLNARFGVRFPADEVLAWAADLDAQRRLFIAEDWTPVGEERDPWETDVLTYERQPLIYPESYRQAHAERMARTVAAA
jgi:hypothetical protein